MEKFVNKLELYYINSNLRKPERPSPTFLISGFYLIKIILNDGSYYFGEPHPYSGKKKEFIDVIKAIFKDIYKLKLENINLPLIKKKRNPKINELCKSSCLAAIDNSIQCIKNKITNKFEKDKKENITKLYASGGMIFDDQNIKLLVDEMLNYKEKKFSGWKFRPPFPRNFKSHNKRLQNPDSVDVKKLMKICELLRFKAGNNFDLMIDVGCRCKDFKDLKYLLEGLKDLNFRFVEEPTLRNINSYKQIKKNIKKKPKIAFGESIFSLEDTNVFFKNKLIDIFQPDTNLLLQNELKIISRLSLKYNIELIPHNWFNIINFSSNLMFINSIKKKDKLIEFNTIKNPYNKFFINNMFFIKKNKVFLKKKNYKGIDVKLNRIKKYKIYETI